MTIPLSPLYSYTSKVLLMSTLRKRVIGLLAPESPIRMRPSVIENVIPLFPPVLPERSRLPEAVMVEFAPSSEKVKVSVFSPAAGTPPTMRAAPSSSAGLVPVKHRANPLLALRFLRSSDVGGAVLRELPVRQCGREVVMVSEDPFVKTYSMIRVKKRMKPYSCRCAISCKVGRTPELYREYMIISNLIKLAKEALDLIISTRH